VFHDIPPSLKYDEGDGQSSGARTHRHIPLELVHLRTEHQVNCFVGCDYNIMGKHRRGSNSESGRRLLRRLEKSHDGIRSAATRQHYIQIYQAVKSLSLDIAQFIEQGPQMTELLRV
jgi:hypothetical protein